MTEPTQGAQAVDRAAALLRLITAADVPLTYTQLHARSGLAKSTVSRLLLALERNDLVRRDGRGYLPGACSNVTEPGRPVGVVAAGLSRLAGSGAEQVPHPVVKFGAADQVPQLPAGQEDHPPVVVGPAAHEQLRVVGLGKVGGRVVARLPRRADRGP